MDGRHEHFEQLAVGHVLGGLSAAEAATFRSHLLGCRHCRSRIAELRGIASDLADAEREERSRGAVRTQAVRRAEEEAPAEPRSRITVRHVTIAVIAVMVIAGAMAFWNLHLRTVAATYRSVVEEQAEALDVLAAGAELEPEVAEDLAGIATTDGERVSLVLSGLEPLGEGEYLVAWLEDYPDGGSSAHRIAGPDQPEDGVVAVSLRTGGAAQLTVTHEVQGSVEQPTGERVAQVELVAEP
ncbi:MAG: anti-sigma factor domain-containing protein [Actinomycetota bacterium]